VVKRASSYADQNLSLIDLRLRNIFIAKFFWTAELAEQDSLQSRSKLFASKVWFKLHTILHLGCLHLFRTDSQRTFILEEPVSLNSQEQMESEKVASELKGNTLRVYWYVMNAKEQTVGVREVQRALNFSSPTLALYHLDKLKDLGLVSKDTGEYRLIKEVKVDVLKQFLRLGRVFVPRFALYAALFTVLFVYYVLIIPDLNLFTFFGIIFGGLGSAIFWFETWKAWKQQP